MNPALLALLGARAAVVASVPDGTFEFVTSSTNGTSATPQTFSGLALGTASANRSVIIGVTCTGGGTAVTGVTVGGVAATARYSAWDSTVAGAAVYTVALPAGATGDVVVTTTSASVCSIGVWAAYGTLTYSAGASGQGGSATLVAPANARSIVCYAATNDLTVSVSGFTPRMPETGVTSATRAAVGDAQPAAGSHTVTIGTAPNYYSILIAADFSLT